MSLEQQKPEGQKQDKRILGKIKRLFSGQKREEPIQEAIERVASDYFRRNPRSPSPPKTDISTQPEDLQSQESPTEKYEAVVRRGANIVADEKEGVVEGRFPRGIYLRAANPQSYENERRAGYEVKEVYNTLDSYKVEGVVEYKAMLPDRRWQYNNLEGIVIKFPRIVYASSFREEYRHFQTLADKGYPWFPKPVGIIENPFGIAVTKCEGVKLDHHITSLTQSEKSHIFRELSSAHIALINENIALMDWKQADVLFDRKTGQVSYVDLNTVEKLTEGSDFRQVIANSMNSFYKEIILNLMASVEGGRRYISSHDPVALKIKEAIPNFHQLQDLASVKRSAIQHLKGLRFQQITPKY